MLVRYPQVILGEGTVAEIVVRPGCVYAVAGAASQRQGLLVDGPGQGTAVGRPEIDQAFPKQHWVAYRTGEFHRGVPGDAHPIPVAGKVAHEREA